MLCVVNLTGVLHQVDTFALAKILWLYNISFIKLNTKLLFRRATYVVDTIIFLFKLKFKFVILSGQHVRLREKIVLFGFALIHAHQSIS